MESIYLVEKNKIVYIEDTIYFDESLIVKKVTESKDLTFSAIKGWRY